ncbi:MAG: Coenzyme synthesis protein (PqqD) [Proteobacteria bacterium]|nr:Coenzyme synthesis protein (PqqD) [Pseudomonadota bacterium]
MSITIDSIIRRNDELLTAEVDGELVMMSIASGQYFGLDDIGARIWELLGEPLKIAELCIRLAQEYAVETSVCERDVLALLHTMEKHDMIIISTDIASDMAA